MRRIHDLGRTDLMYAPSAFLSMTPGLTLQQGPPLRLSNVLFQQSTQSAFVDYTSSSHLRERSSCRTGWHNRVDGRVSSYGTVHCQRPYRFGEDA